MAPYPLPLPCVDAALLALSGWGRANARERIAHRARAARAHAAALRRLPGVREVLPSQANFLAVRFDDAGAVYRRLLAAGIVVRDVRRYPDLGDALRITVGTPEENDRVLAVLRSPAMDGRVSVEAIGMSSAQDPVRRPRRHPDRGAGRRADRQLREARAAAGRDRRAAALRRGRLRARDGHQPGRPRHGEFSRKPHFERPARTAAADPRLAGHRVPRSADRPQLPARRQGHAQARHRHAAALPRRRRLEPRRIGDGRRSRDRPAVRREPRRARLPRRSAGRRLGAIWRIALLRCAAHGRRSSATRRKRASASASTSTA